MASPMALIRFSISSSLRLCCLRKKLRKVSGRAFCSASSVGQRSSRAQTRGIAVGTSVARRPPHGSVRALFSAHGSYRRYLASKRKLGYG
jgi:hypothetical protein